MDAGRYALKSSVSFRLRIVEESRSSGAARAPLALQLRPRPLPQETA